MTEQSRQILAVFDKYRMASGSIDQYDIVGRNLLAERFDGFISKNEPIRFYMLGYPHKSMNTRDKVIGDMPDFGEEVTLLNFVSFNAEVKAIYEPGIEMNIVSDGYVFNDLMDIFDRTVMEYGEINEDFVLRYPFIKFYNLTHFYALPRLALMREKLMQDWAISPDELTAKILTDADTNILYRGMMHFMEEDIAIRGYDSRNQKNKAAKKLTREMMLRNEAYSALVKKEFGDHAIRLSMHKSINNGAKYSFNLYPADVLQFTSPWHSALAIDAKGRMKTVHRKDAEEAGYDLMWQDNRARFFIKDGVFSDNVFEM